MSEAGQININSLISSLEAICKQCDQLNAGDCQPGQCLVGFALRLLQFANQKGIWDIPDVQNHIPVTDMKPYFLHDVIPALAETCRQCKDCQDNHSDDCIVAITRTCLENTLLEKNIPTYPGSVFMYLAMLKKQAPEIAEHLAKELNKQNGAG